LQNSGSSRLYNALDDDDDIPRRVSRRADRAAVLATTTSIPAEGILPALTERDFGRERAWSIIA
jgi:hypothetical protein